MVPLLWAKVSEAAGSTTAMAAARARRWRSRVYFIGSLLLRWDRWGCKRRHYSGFPDSVNEPRGDEGGHGLARARGAPSARASAAQTAEITATASAPASMTAAALSAVMPPIPTKGTGISGRSFRTRSGPTSWKPALVPVG